MGIIVQRSRSSTEAALPAPTAPLPASSAGRVAPVCLRSLLAELLRRGIAPQLLFQGLMLEAGELEVPGTMVAHRLAVTVVRRALGLMTDPDLGFTLGAQSRITDRGALALGLLASSTLGDAMALEMQFPRSAGHLLSVRDERPPGLHITVAEPLPGDHDIEAFLADELFASTVKLRRLISGADYVPRRVELVHLRPPQAQMVERYFGCAVHYGSLRNRLISDLHWLELASPLASAVALHQSVDLLQRENPGGADAASLSLSIEAEILRLLPRVVSPSELAEHLNLSDRSLRRGLAAQAISYRQLLDGCRKSRALELLQVGRRSVAEAALQTGFANAASFRRAFKRWTGGNAPVADAI